MATFYILPPRACLDDAVAAFLGKLLPGLPAPSWDRLADGLGRPGVYFVPRDELPDGESLAEALAGGFGAEFGDRVVEVALTGAARAWVVGGVSGAAAA
ncbi:hypothetical protein [Urbifossiella limnaea]|uniref:Uncharacterized protein n=1 Tax=Urbifossiella limnaea TaxID=2528023 RepID=A0A517XSB0_9BACT|nr:hypothetical protein [Urbifossiella limnaea]QDU20388.1 hypothetical protein ETAA1_23400 [Urbifossiella limnaea]